jgi:hypothetical protein
MIINSKHKSLSIERFDGYVIEPCKRFPLEGDPFRFTFEECSPDMANTWTLYGHIPGVGVETVGHYQTRREAEAIFARIMGSSYRPYFEPLASLALEGNEVKACPA